MPILTVEFVGEPTAPDLAQKLADAAGEALGSASGRTWVKLRRLDAYAENGKAGKSGEPVFISVILAEHNDLAKKASDLSSAFSKVLGLPQENIHVIFEAQGRGRVAFGGKL